MLKLNILTVQENNHKIHTSLNFKIVPKLILDQIIVADNSLNFSLFHFRVIFSFAFLFNLFVSDFDGLQLFS